MIIKEKDSLQPQIDQLEKLLSESLPESKRAMLDKELRMLHSGQKGEKDSAYYIDFHFRDSKNWAAIHDLRLEHKGHVAQIDHLIINRLLEIYVLESKHYRQGMKINEQGEFFVLFNGGSRAVPSPIEQNKRHIFLMERYLADAVNWPKRLGLTIKPVYKSLILVSPDSKVIRPQKKDFDTSMIIKSDVFYETITRDINAITALSLAKTVSPETLKTIAEEIAQLHIPMQMDYQARFGLDEPQPTPLPVSTPAPEQKSESHNRYFCARCKVGITQKVAYFCFQNKPRFGGKAYCFDCQKQINGTAS